MIPDNILSNLSLLLDPTKRSLLVKNKIHALLRSFPFAPPPRIKVDVHILSKLGELITLGWFMINKKMKSKSVKKHQISITNLNSLHASYTNILSSESGVLPSPTKHDAS